MTTSTRILINMANYRARMSDERKELEKQKSRERMRRLRQARREAAASARAQQPPQPPRAQQPPQQAGHQSRNGRPLTTEQQQQNRVRRIAKALAEEYVPDGSNTWLNDTPRVIEYLMGKYANADTRRSYLSAVVRELRDKAGVPFNVVKEYRDKMTHHILAIETRVGENTRSEADKAVWMEWPEIRAKGKSVKKWNNPLTQTIYGLYVGLPPRHTDYNDLKLREYSIKAYRRYSPIENVLWMTRGMKRIKMISLSKYKGSGLKGVYTTARSKNGSHGAKMPALVANPLTKMIAGKQEGDYVFPAQYRNPQAFAKLVGDTFERATGKRQTINTLRKIWATNELRKNPSQNRKKQLVRFMGTSIRMFHSAYNKTRDGESKEGII